MARTSPEGEAGALAWRGTHAVAAPLTVELSTFESIDTERELLERTVTALSEAGQTSAVFRHEGTLVARWEDGHLRGLAPRP